MRSKFIILVVYFFTNLLLSQSNFKLGETAYSKGNFKEAIAYFDKAIVQNDNVYYAYLNRGLAYLYIDEISKCKYDLDTAYALDSTKVNAYVYYGKYYAERRLYAMALKHYNKALEIDPEYYEIYGERGAVKLMLGMNDEALEDATISVNHVSNDYSVYANRGYIEMVTDKYEEALIDFTKSLEIQESQKAYGNRGFVYSMLGKYDLALKDIDKALGYNENDALILYMKGEVYIKLGEKENACQCFLKSKENGNIYIDDVLQAEGCLK